MFSAANTGSCMAASILAGRSLSRRPIPPTVKHAKNSRQWPVWLLQFGFAFAAERHNRVTFARAFEAMGTGTPNCFLFCVFRDVCMRSYWLGGRYTRTTNNSSIFPSRSYTQNPNQLQTLKQAKLATHTSVHGLE